MVFKYVIDVSELYRYMVFNKKILKEMFKLNLEKYFPNSKIITSSNLSDSEYILGKFQQVNGDASTDFLNNVSRFLRR